MILSSLLWLVVSMFPSYRGRIERGGGGVGRRLALRESVEWTAAGSSTSAILRKLDETAGVSIALGWRMVLVV